MDLSDEIADLGMADDLSAVLVEVVARYGAEVDRQPGYISVRPPGRYIAAYFNKNMVDIVVVPDQATSLAVAHPGTRILPKQTSTTAFLHVPKGLLGRDAVVELVGTALHYRELGNSWSGEVGSGIGADLVGETCKTCFLTLAANGTCGCD